MPEWWARRCRTWSKKPTPVFTSACPSPSSSRRTLTYVSPVLLSAVPIRVIVLPVSGLQCNQEVVAGDLHSFPEVEPVRCVPLHPRVELEGRTTLLPRHPDKPVEH